jgi:hypothetical protein
MKQILKVIFECFMYFMGLIFSYLKECVTQTMERL